MGQLKAGSSTLHKSFQDAPKAMSRNTANFSCCRVHYLLSLLVPPSPWAKPPQPEGGDYAGHGKHVPRDRWCSTLDEGKNCFALVLGKLSPCTEQKSHGTKRGFLQPAAECLGHHTSGVYRHLKHSLRKRSSSDTSHGGESPHSTASTAEVPGLLVRSVGRHPPYIPQGAASLWVCPLTVDQTWVVWGRSDPLHLTDTNTVPMAAGPSPALSPLLRLAQGARRRADESPPVSFLTSIRL